MARRKSNPEVRLSSAMGNVLLDYHQISENVEHVAACALRGERVDTGILRKARNDLARSAKEQRDEEREQMEDLVEAMDKVLSKYRKGNPARAFSLGTEVKRGRQKKAKGAAGRATRASSAASDAASMNLKKRLSKINPGSYKKQISGFSDARLDKEHKAISGLIARASKHPKGSARSIRDLKSIRTEIVAEKKKRRKKNPSTAGDPILTRLAKTYRRQRMAYANLIASPGSSEVAVDRAKARVEKSENQLVTYAEIQNISPIELQKFMASLETKAKSKRKPNPSAAKIDERSHELVQEMPHLGTLAAYPRAASMWESVYVDSRLRGYSKERSAKQAWGAVKDAGYRKDTKGIWRMPKRRFNPGEHPKENPLTKVPARASEKQARAIISKNIASEMEAGRKQRQAVAIALASARRDAPKVMEKMYGPRPNPYLGDAVSLAKTRKTAKKKATKKRKTPPPLPLSARKKKTHRVQVANPKKKLADASVDELLAEYDAMKKSGYKSSVAGKSQKEIEKDLRRLERKGKKLLREQGIDPDKLQAEDVKEVFGSRAYLDEGRRVRFHNPKKVKRKTKPGWKILTDRCEKLWKDYCDNPTKKNLRRVFDHLDKMKASTKYETSKRVRDERAACLRVANKEAKRLGMKK